jgi:hypothetical protein
LLQRGGLILGAFPDASFEEETVSLDPGDVLVVFSDGITEAVSQDGSEFGEGTCSPRSVPVENYLQHACCRTCWTLFASSSEARTRAMI